MRSEMLSYSRAAWSICGISLQEELCVQMRMPTSAYRKEATAALVIAESKFEAPAEVGRWLPTAEIYSAIEAVIEIATVWGRGNRLRPLFGKGKSFSPGKDSVLPTLQCIARLRV